MGTSCPGALRITGPVASTDPRLPPAPWPDTGPAPVAGMEGGALTLPGGVGPPDGVTRDLADVGRLPTPVGKGPMPHKAPNSAHAHCPNVCSHMLNNMTCLCPSVRPGWGWGRGSDDLLMCRPWVSGFERSV
jgi:hypothetical protein